MTTQPRIRRDLPLRLAGAMLGVVLLILAAGFFFQFEWAKALWPLPDGPLSFAFMAAILAGSAAPLIWIAWSGALGALVPYGLSFGLMDIGIAVYALILYARDDQTNLLVFGVLFGVFALVSFVAALWARRIPLTDERQTPRLVRISMFIEVGVLSLVGWLLVFQVPNILPWPLRPESSVIYGCVFLGLALYYLLPVLQPKWHYAVGPLLGFLLYDLVLIGPLFARLSVVKSEHLLGLIVALIIIVYSAALGIRYLFFARATSVQTASA